MGGHLCKPSKASWDVTGETAASNKRHTDDFCLSYLELVPTGLLAFDDTFGQIETVLNHLIELNNDVNDAVIDVKAAYAACVGHLQLDVATGVPDVDWVLLDIHLAASGSPYSSRGNSGGGGGGGGSGRNVARPNPVDLQALRDKDGRLRDADAALQKAHTAMHAALVAYFKTQHAQQQLSRRSTGAGIALAAVGQGGAQVGQNGGRVSGAGRGTSQQQQQQHLASTTALGVSSATGAPARQPVSPGSRGPQPATPPAAGPAPGHVHLEVSPDGQYVTCQPDLPEVQRFNDALTMFRRCLGVHRYQVKVIVKNARVPGTPTIRARVLKPDKTDELQVTGWYDASATSSEPASVLDVACIEVDGAVEAIKEAELALLHKTQWLAAKTHDLDAVEWHVLRKHKVTLAAIIPDVERRTLIRKALVETNSALFSIMACTANPDGQGTLAGAVAEVARQLCLVLRKRWDSRGGLPMPLKTLLSVSTSLSFKDAGVFEFAVHAESLPEAQLGIFPSCLPIPGQELLARIELLSTTISNALKQLPNISSQLDQLTEQARDFYDMVPDAAAQKGLSMMEAIKAGKAVGCNLQALFSSQQLFQAFALNVKRVADDLARAQADVDRAIMLQAQEAVVNKANNVPPPAAPAVEL